MIWRFVISQTSCLTFNLVDVVKWNNSTPSWLINCIITKCGDKKPRKLLSAIFFFDSCQLSIKKKIDNFVWKMSIINVWQFHCDLPKKKSKMAPLFFNTCQFTKIRFCFVFMFSIVKPDEFFCLFYSVSFYLFFFSFFLLKITFLVK